MIFYINGCSHTLGGPVIFKNTWSSLLVKNLTKDESMIISPIEDLNYINTTNVGINDAQNGAGNDYILHKSYESISKLIGMGKKPDYAFIQWSGPNRRMHMLPNGKILFVNLYDYTHLNVKLEPMASEQTIHYMYSLQEFLIKNDIKYRFLNYFELDKSIYGSHILPMINLDNFINFGNDKIHIFDGILNIIKDKKLSADEQGHPNENGHVFIADKFFSNL